MKHLSEYRNKDMINALSKEIGALSRGGKFTFMEVCGTHTMAVARFGIKELLPENIRLLSGPGCPVCVTPNDYIDHAVALSRLPNVIITTFGDMLRVPGSTSSLEKEKAAGGDIRIVYSPLDTMKIAAENPGKEVVFLSIGFETTIPTIASTIVMAKKSGLKNLSFLTSNKVVPPALEALLQGELKLDGFMLPGHVSTIIGGKAYQPMIEKYRIPCSIAGFEPTDMLESIKNLVEQKLSDSPHLAMSYRRVVTFEGNKKAQDVINEVFVDSDAVWRGIGTIPGSGHVLRKAFADFDAALKIDVKVEETRENRGCLCGAILQGLKNPPDCPLFGKTCSPENPVGACMVSGEGTCAAWYKYGRQ